MTELSPSLPATSSGGAAANGTPMPDTLSVIETWMDVKSELIDFCSRRIREETATQHRLLHCRNPAELVGVQFDFCLRACSDYLAEAGRVVELTRPVVPKQFW